MNIGYYKNFVTIVESGSLTAAARELSISQPSLSLQLKNLEEHYNIKLINLSRGVSKLELTDAGKIFYEKAKYIITLENATLMELTNFGKGLAGTIRISISPAKVSSFITNFLQPFQKNHPLITYEIREVPVNEQINHILNGISDFAIANAPLPEPHRFDILLSERDPLIMLANKNNPWIPYDSKKISLKSLTNVPLCINFGCKQLFENTCQSQGIIPNFLSVSTTQTTALKFASLNLGVAIVAAENYETFSNDLFTLPIVSKNLFIEKRLFKAKGKIFSPIVNNFIEFYQEKSILLKENKEGE